MLINIKTPVSLNINHLTNLKNLRTFMEDKNLKVHKSEIACQLGVDRRTVSKYMDDFEKSKQRSKPSKLDSYYNVIETVSSIVMQLGRYRNKYRTKRLPVTTNVIR